jgi:hypothetical protein
MKLIFFARQKILKSELYYLLEFGMSAFANEIFKNVSAGELCALIIASVHSTGLDEPADQRDAEEHTSGKKHSVLFLDN